MKGRGLRNRKVPSMFENAMNQFHNLVLSMDYDWDGVPNQKDCRPFNPFLQHIHKQKSLTPGKITQSRFLTGYGDPELRGIKKEKPKLKQIKGQSKIMRFLEGLDSDQDGVPDVKDCEPYNPKKHTTGYIYDEEGNILEEGDLKEIAKKHFGVTDKPREAGYILPGGEMLDFTGRHQAVGYKNRVPTDKDYLKYRRSLDHRDIGQVMKTGGTEGMIQFQSEDGAIRFSKFEDGDIYIDMVKKPTPEQIETIVRAMIMFPRGDYLLIERTNEQGIVVNPVKHRLETNRPHPVLLQKFISRAWEK